MFFWNSCFFHDPADVGNLISGSSAFSKTSLNIRKFTVHVLLKPGLENFAAAAAAAKSRQSCPTLCNPIDGIPPGFPVPGILQARTLEWVAFSFSNAWKWKVKYEVAQSCPTLATTWTAAYQAPPSMGFSRQKYWSGVPLPSAENFEHYFTSMWDECDCVVVWEFFGISFLWGWNENWPFPVLWPLLSLPNLLACWVQHFHSIIFQDLNSSTGIPLALFIVMLYTPIQNKVFVFFLS